jgi:hypothetical protein
MPTSSLLQIQGQVSTPFTLNLQLSQEFPIFLIPLPVGILHHKSRFKKTKKDKEQPRAGSYAAGPTLGHYRRKI